MRISRTQALVVVNAALLASLAGVTFGPRAVAQADRSRATYLLTAGTIKGTDSSAIWIVDETNQEVIAVIWNPQQNQLEGLGYRNLLTDGASLAGRQRN